MEYAASQGPQVFHPPQPSALAPQPGLDWVTAQSSSYAGEAHSTYQPYSGMGASTSGGNGFAPFDEEPPLLEGRLRGRGDGTGGGSRQPAV